MMVLVCLTIPQIQLNLFLMLIPSQKAHWTIQQSSRQTLNFRWFQQITLPTEELFDWVLHYAKSEALSWHSTYPTLHR
uniref:Putative secreted protein n=1 Tax=Anopheles darlingi TaxID=43151 RepID=A0A2M4DBM1_ANODA